jgi:hypothetical protein
MDDAGARHSASCGDTMEQRVGERSRPIAAPGCTPARRLVHDEQRVVLEDDDKRDRSATSAFLRQRRA